MADLRKPTLDPDAIRAACDEVMTALNGEDPISELRTLAIDIAGRGLGRAGTCAVFVSVCENLTEAGRDEESRTVAYVLDMIAEW